ncbi:UDP-N-acetylglucosamine--N-acetylmuramyl-(pentapeptide) pyrophosphoryl-undecaprenol N-acetylglucosamine transferase [Paenibacillus herberti]|uniref:UDP-N-acetylglucosamine--N-acetylmuramyl-(pentapeptide) pyrophosphoryl-undecaprenol N-acetylglucosamine transferase n=2 Tax=Paenibacillus herberti TaxID=1619309 RepID=A0A229NWJ3_9BACL|nr:UDP-N-acetylglucosamine--N-acetylmuramyl-(pentapeptide) pyrophosphoryl-undecaprenol N-acetylglucosamine transferase [Paenibacillus herberti]
MKMNMKNRHQDKTIVLTGGGSTGHVSVNLALIPGLLADGWSVHYIGSKDGIERSLIEPLKGVTYHDISTGKLRRYWDKRNLSDMLRVGKGLVQAAALLRRLRPDVVFSKGGFVSVPVVLGAKLNRIPAIIHESDVTPGLANRIAIPCATAVCTTFPETAAYIRGARVVQVGPLVRPELYNGDAERGRKLCGFDRSRPVLLVMGGSLGSRRLNEAITEALPELLPRWQIVHLRGKGQVASGAAAAGGSAASGLAANRSATGRLTVSGLAAGGSMASESATSESVSEPGYRSFEYLSEELPDVLALADAVLTRAGANALFEMLALRKPMLLVPLPLSQSRGDQLRNAASFEAAGLARVLPEEKLSTVTLLQELRALTTGDPELQDRLIAAAPADPLPQLHDLIRQTARGRS